MMNRFRIWLTAFAAAAVLLAIVPEARSEGDSPPEGAAEVHKKHDKEAGGGGHVPNTNPLSIDPDLAICTAIVFLLLFAILAKFAWGPIATGLEKREQSIANAIDDANRSAKEAKVTLQEYESKLAAATDEVRQMLDNAKKNAEATKDQIVADAKAAAQKERERAVQDIHLAKDAAISELAAKSVDTAVALAGRMIHKEVKSKDHADLIKEALEQFPNQN